uniref:Uncharacterized protein n=1 Tax=Curvibacter symbiont subsp. Hydra magnipapillata TaxID=667019 RepID=C9Y903_CURXX|nr:hypothetical protein Csp_A06040 [Curvibacter putative symbiont of Hydra magnipapillata]
MYPKQSLGPQRGGQIHCFAASNSFFLVSESSTATSLEIQVEMWQ